MFIIRERDFSYLFSFELFYNDLLQRLWQLMIKDLNLRQSAMGIQS